MGRGLGKRAYTFAGVIAVVKGPAFSVGGSIEWNGVVRILL
jgi:hypothetical protein